MPLWIVLLLLSVAPPAFGRCSCLCVEGSLRTLCTNIVEAQLNPALCGPTASIYCPALSADEVGEREIYDSPFAEGVGCREVRVWDPASEGYTAVKVCDVLPGDESRDRL